jgi:hypothetical protein
MSLFPSCVCSPQEMVKMPCNQPKSRFAQRVNRREGCWYHSQQDHDPSLTLSNQIKCQDVTLPLLCLLPTMIVEDAPQKNWILCCPKSQQLRRMLVPQSTRPRSQFNAEQSNEMPRYPRWCEMWHVAEYWIWWKWTLFWYVRVHMNKNTFYIDSYLRDRIRTCLHWSVFMSQMSVLKHPILIHSSGL